MKNFLNTYLYKIFDNFFQLFISLSLILNITFLLFVSTKKLFLIYFFLNILVVLTLVLICQKLRKLSLGFNGQYNKYPENNTGVHHPLLKVYSLGFLYVLIVIMALFRVVGINREQIYEKSLVGDYRGSFVVQNKTKSNSGFSYDLKIKLALKIKENKGNMEKKIITPKDLNVQCFLKEELDIGKEYVAKGTLREIEGKKNYYSPNLKNYYLKNGVFLKVHLNNGSIKSTGNLKHSPRIYFNKIKENLSLQVKNPYFDTLFLGKKDTLEEEVKQEIHKLNINHLFSISGLHFQVIINLVFLLFLGLLKSKRSFMIPMLSLLFLYSYMVNVVSIYRVLVFLILSLIFKRLNIGFKNTTLLLLTCSIFMLINPFLILNSAFVYTFLVTFGIYLYLENGGGGNIFKIGTIAFLFSLGYSLFLNFQINIISLILTPILGFIIFLSIILCFIIFILGISNFSFFLLLADYFSKILFKIMDLALIILEYFSKFQIKIITGKINIVVVIVYYLFLMFLIKRKSHGNRKYALNFIILGWVLLLINFNSIYGFLFFSKERLFIHSLNVGQGDSFLVEHYRRNKKTVILIDTGKVAEPQNETKKEVIPYLLGRNIDKIDYLILSHGDLDHSGGLQTIYENSQGIVVGKVITHDLRKSTKGLEYILEKEISVFQGEKGNSLKIDSLEIAFLNDSKEIQKNEEDLNNMLSVVSIFTFKGKKIILSGDSKFLQKDKLNNLGPIFLLQVPHHGSKNNYKKGVYADLEYDNAIISVGKNFYGHPHKEVLWELDKNQSENKRFVHQKKYYRTDINKNKIFEIK